MKVIHKLFLAFTVTTVIAIAATVFVLTRTADVKFSMNGPVVGLEDHAAFATKELQTFFTELNQKLSMAGRMERDRSLNDLARARMIIGEMTGARSLLGILLLDRGMNVSAGMTSDDGTYVLNPDRNIFNRALDSGRIVFGDIQNSSDGASYYDIAVPLNKSPREYLYFRVNLGPLITVLKDYAADRRATMVLYNDIGSAISLTKRKNTLPPKVLLGYRTRPAGGVFADGTEQLVTAVSPDGRWTVLIRGEGEPSLLALARPALFSLAALLVIGLIAFGLSWWISRPITKLANEVEESATGAFGYHRAEKVRDESSRLTAVFSSIQLSMKDYLEDQRRRLSAARNESMTSIISSDGPGESAEFFKKMANIVAHEVRNPLSAIAGAAFLLRHHVTKMPDNSGTPLLKPVGIIENEIKSVTKIIDNLLDYSRTRPPKLVVRDMGEIITDIMGTYKAPDNIAIKLELDVSYKVNVDVDEIKQVVRNLMNNAVDAMSEKGGTLTLNTFRSIIPNKTGKDLPSICLNVTDTGCGIPADKLKSIFEPFFTMKTRGTGLGLAVVRKIIHERHKGFVDVKSKVGEGTTFSVQLPIYQEGVITSAPAAK